MLMLHKGSGPCRSDAQTCKLPLCLIPYAHSVFAGSRVVACWFHRHYPQLLKLQQRIRTTPGINEFSIRNTKDPNPFVLKLFSGRGEWTKWALPLVYKNREALVLPFSQASD